MAIGMAIIPAPWSARVDVFLPVRRRRGQCAAGAGPLPGRRDAETGLRICTAMQAVLDRAGEPSPRAPSGSTPSSPSMRPGCPTGVRGAALVGRAQLALSSDPAGARQWAQDGLALSRAAGRRILDRGRAQPARGGCPAYRPDPGGGAARRRGHLAGARAAGDGWNEGYALGSRAAAAGWSGNFREAEEFADASIAVMRRLDQQWGVARTLLGLGDLGRLRGDPAGASQHYLDALSICARSTPGRRSPAAWPAWPGSRWTSGDLAAARQHLAESLRLEPVHRVPDQRGPRPGGVRRARGRGGPAGPGRAAGGRGREPPRGGEAPAAFRGQDRAVPGRGPRSRGACHPATVGAGIRLTAARRRRLGLDDPAGCQHGPGPRRGTADAAALPAGLTPRERRDRRAHRQGPQQQGHRQGALHQPGDGGQARFQHPRQAGVLLAFRGGRLGDGGDASPLLGELPAGTPRARPGWALRAASAGSISAESVSRNLRRARS